VAGAEIEDETSDLTRKAKLMTAKCANPSCSVPFHRLRGGRLFRFEVHVPSNSCHDVPETVRSMKSGVASVYFWLCEKCALTNTLGFDGVRGLSVKPRDEVRCFVQSKQDLRLAAVVDQAA